MTERSEDALKAKTPCRCYWCNRARGMSKEEAQRENDRSLSEKRP